MIGNEQTLQDIVRIAKCGRDFFVEMYPCVTDPEVRTAFVYISETKSRLVNELTPWVPRPEERSANCSSSVVIVEQLYLDARAKFRGDTPASIANALSAGEDKLLKLVERAFNDARAPALKRLLKSYYTELSICRGAMWRLHSRLAA